MRAATPAIAFGVAFTVIQLAHLDRLVADAFFYDATQRAWIGAGGFWSKDVIHSGGGALVRLIGALALLTLILSYTTQRFRGLRRDAAYVVLGMALCTGLVGLLKQLTNVDCPWSLEPYGGSIPYVPIFADRPDGLARAACFPGAHSSSAFSLMCFYLLLRERSLRQARWALIGALLLGTIFSLGQQARGAHFLSHDLASVAICWYVLLGLAWAMRLETVAGYSIRLRTGCAGIDENERPRSGIDGGGGQTT